MDRIQEVLKKLREKRNPHPPQIERDGYHVKVGGNGDMLEEDFNSSGYEGD